jgi:mRNA interferase HigB
MRIIARRTLREFSASHPRSRQPLDDWYSLVTASYWESPADVKLMFRSADFLPDNRVVFNIAGNTFRLVVKIEYRFQTVFIRFIGTHAQYDRIDATTV